MHCAGKADGASAEQLFNVQLKQMVLVLILFCNVQGKHMVIGDGA